MAGRGSKYSSTLSLTAALSVGGRSVARQPRFSLAQEPRYATGSDCTGAKRNAAANYAIQTPSLCVSDN